MHYPGRGACVLGPRYEPWGVDIAPPCPAPDPAGSCPNCFSHDNPNDPERAPGKGPKAWWDNSSCRNPEFRRPDLGTPAELTLARLHDRRALLARVERLRRDLDAAEPVQAHEVYRLRAMELPPAQQ